MNLHEPSKDPERRLAHVYGQPYPHGDARIVGNLDALVALHQVLTSMLRLDEESTQRVPMWATDGEGYELEIVRRDGFMGAPNWRDKAPEYTRPDRDIVRAVLRLLDGIGVPEAVSQPIAEWNELPVVDEKKLRKWVGSEKETDAKRTA